jgi:RND superfamily putative drug exporter
VRTVIVPALFGILGDRMWWPGTPPRHEAQLSHEHCELTVDAR